MKNGMSGGAAGIGAAVNAPGTVLDLGFDLVGPGTIARGAAQLLGLPETIAHRHGPAILVLAFDGRGPGCPDRTLRVPVRLVAGGEFTGRLRERGENWLVEGSLRELVLAVACDLLPFEIASQPRRVFFARGKLLLCAPTRRAGFTGPTGGGSGAPILRTAGKRPTPPPEPRLRGQPAARKPSKTSPGKARP